MNPFAEIEVTPLFYRDGMKSQGNSVRIRDDEQVWEEIGVVSPNYLLVHNSKVKETLDTIADKSNINDWKERKVFFDGRRFIYAITTDTVQAEIAPGDCIRFGLIAYNSYDGSRALSVGAYAEHLLCSNGMTSDMYFARFTFRHQKGNINWDEETEKAFTSIMPQSKERLVRFASVLGKLNRKVITLMDLKYLRKEFLQEFNSSSWGKVMDRYLLHEKHNAFGLLDACTRIFWQNAKPSVTDYRNNTYATDGMINFSQRLN